MKWGIRRYQNKDGSLTAAGKKRYDKMSAEQLRNSLQKSVTSKRISRYHQGDFSNTIGENSKKAVDEWQAANKKQTESKAYKEWANKSAKLDEKWENGDIDDDTYFSKLDELDAFFDKNIYDAKLDATRRTSDKGWTFVSDYLNSYGGDITMGYIRDLGFNEETAKYLTKRLVSDKKALF